MNHDETTRNDEEEWEDPEQQDWENDINESDQEDDWQDINVIDYWQAAFKGYMSYHKKDADPAILIPAPKRRSKKREDHTKGIKRKWEDEDIEEQGDEIEEEQQDDQEQVIQDVEDAEQQEATEQQYNDPYQYYNYYHQQYPHTSYQGYTSANVSGHEFAQAPPPPPPPPFPNNPSTMAAQDNEAFANMIMAWYYSGYYTGYYQVSVDEMMGAATLATAAAWMAAAVKVANEFK
ncbi:hypothetical protein K492DRAFT_196656 [Lichtheimia hyalospora FSU 10163]|nr:hypothetical protein K492DRAFT_196656 [Lichtheimia hyalospora FSU 10163]